MERPRLGLHLALGIAALATRNREKRQYDPGPHHKSLANLSNIAQFSALAVCRGRGASFGVPSSPLFWASLVGAGLAVFRAFRAHMAFVHPAMFEAITLRLCREGRLDRLKKICDAAPASAFPRAVRAALTALETHGPDDQRDRFDVAQEAYRRQFQMRRAQSGSVSLDIAAAVLVGVPAAAALDDATLPRLWLFGLATLALVALLHTARQRRMTASRSVENVTELLTALVEAKQLEVSPERPERGVYRAPAPLLDEPMAPAASVVVSLNGAELSRHAIPAEGVLKIGRLPSAHISIDHPSVARLHAVLEATPGSLEIIDLGSPSGLVVNGLRANKQALKSGDKIRVGACELVVASDEHRPAPQPAPEPAWTCPRCGSEGWNEVPLPEQLAASLTARACAKCRDVSWRAVEKL